jgi:hypothetical protein
MRCTAIAQIVDEPQAQPLSRWLAFPASSFQSCKASRTFSSTGKVGQISTFTAGDVARCSIRSSAKAHMFTWPWALWTTNPRSGHPNIFSWGRRRSGIQSLTTCPNLTRFQPMRLRAKSDQVETPPHPPRARPGDPRKLGVASPALRDPLSPLRGEGRVKGGGAKRCNLSGSSSSSLSGLRLW